MNGLHEDWIDWCVEAMSDRQCFLTSQNPLLVDMVPMASKEEVQRGIIRCEADGATGELRLEQLDDRTASIIAEAMQRSRLDMLSDLLHALDLW